MGAYFTGKYLGHTPLSAASPNKTQEGLIGGVLTSLVVTFVVVGLIGISPVGDEISQAFIFALLCALVAPLGDLCESFIKRDLGIKDMGSDAARATAVCWTASTRCCSCCRSPTS